MSPLAFTTPYRPPEVLLEKKNYDESADIWSLGCVMSEMFTKLTEVSNNLKRSNDYVLFGKNSKRFPLKPGQTYEFTKDGKHTTFKI
jgi:serine/threonine protein kinase